MVGGGENIENGQKISKEKLQYFLFIWGGPEPTRTSYWHSFWVGVWEQSFERHGICLKFLFIEKVIFLTIQIQKSKKKKIKIYA